MKSLFGTRKRNGWERSFEGLLILFMTLLSFTMLYPFIYALAYSLSDSTAAAIQPITFLPVKPTLSNYYAVFQNTLILNAMGITVARTIAGVLFAGLIVALAAYAITKTNMPGNRWITFLLIVPMYVSGGLLPSYVVNYHLHLFNSFWIYILPYGFWAFNMLIMRTFFSTLPPSLIESAKMDGASELRIFFRIVLPLSVPVVATIAMFNGVFQWNSWLDTQLYISNHDLYSLAFLLQQILKQSLVVQLMAAQGSLQGNANHVTSPESLKMATLIVSMVPIVLVYPFLQRYFVKGFLIGAVKG